MIEIPEYAQVSPESFTSWLAHQVVWEVAPLQATMPYLAICPLCVAVVVNDVVNRQAHALHHALMIGF